MTDGIHRAFYAGQLLGEYTRPKEFLHVVQLPDGAYYRSGIGAWYLKSHGTFTPINLCDIPNEVRVLCLLLNVTV